MHSSANPAPAARLPPLYYLHNFSRALAWLECRYADLLTADESGFVGTFRVLPVPSQALLVRLLMRRGPYFRQSRIRYPEIGEFQAAIEPLIAAGWVDLAPVLAPDALFSLLRRNELRQIFPDLKSGSSKCAWLARLLEGTPEPRTLAQWHPELSDVVILLSVAPLCARLRRLFFGNDHQDWAQFVLVDLGLVRYEDVAIALDSRAFQSRQDIDAFHALCECRARLHDDPGIPDLVTAFPEGPPPGRWLARQYAKLQFSIGRRLEDEGALDAALQTYRSCSYPESQVRALRVAERMGQYDAALVLASGQLASCVHESQAEALRRGVARLQRRLGGAAVPRRARDPAQVLRLTLPHSDQRVEEAVRRHLGTDAAPVFYVESGLLTSLFGLLCWDAVFAALPGAFFHPFQSGPADLHSRDFVERRPELFQHALGSLQDDTWHERIRTTYLAKAGIQSPFVRWGLLSESLLELSLGCIPAKDLRACFGRLLADLKENCAGLPDLIQFHPRENRYSLIEIKGPGDRLQDNQRRWISFLADNGIAVTVCHVTWA